MAQSLARTTIVITIIALIGKILGLFRDVLIASTFGAGATSDAFFLANTVIMLIVSLIMQAINTTTIPSLSLVEHKYGITRKNELANNLLHIMILLSITLVVLSTFFSPILVKIIAPGFQQDQYTLAIRLTQIGLPAIILMSISGIFRSYLHSEKKFTESALSDLFINVIGIITLLFIANYLGIEVLMISFLVALILQICMQLYGIRKTAFSYSFIINFKDKEVRKIAYLTIPVFFSVGIGNINKMIDNAMASTLAQGSISALTYASKINNLVLGVLITSIITVIFPYFTKAVAKEDYNELSKLFAQGMNVILIITLPISIVIIIFAEPIITLLFQRGSFDSIATKVTSEALAFYSVSLIGMSCRLLLIKIYYALQDTKTPLVNGLIAVIVNIVLNIILIGPMEHKGLALATSIASTVLPLFLILKLKKKIVEVDLSKLAITFGKITFASLIMGIGLYTSKYMLDSVNTNWFSYLIFLTCAAILGSIIYFVCILFLKVEGVNLITSLILKRIKIIKK